MKKIIIIIVLVVIALGYYFISKPAATVAPTVDTTTSTVQPMNNSMPSMDTNSSATPSAPLPTSDSGATATQPSATPTPAASVVSNTSVTSSKASVAIDNYAFNPTPLAVKAGTAITWTNEDSVAHTVTSDSGTVLNSPLIKPGTSFTFTFTTPGTYTYHCSVHPDMHGAVIVTS